MNDLYFFSNFLHTIKPYQNEKIYFHFEKNDKKSGLTTQTQPKTANPYICNGNKDKFCSG